MKAGGHHTIVIKLRIISDTRDEAVGALYKAEDAAVAAVRELPGVQLGGAAYGLKDGHDHTPG